MITVADSGVGIPVSAQEHIFDRFYRGEHAMPDSPVAMTKGTGLGLSIARLIAQAHKGSLILQSSNEEGSTFVAVLPVST